ncbi:hypothetical protein KOPIIPEJ_02308 [Aeromonas dhakensis]
MLDTGMTTPFKNGKVAYQVAVCIGKWVLEGITYPGLRRQMNNPIETFMCEQFSHSFTISQVNFTENKIALTCKSG